MTTEFKKFNVYAYFEQAYLSLAMLTLKMMAFRGDTKSFGNLFDMWLSAWEIIAAHLRSIIEIALKLPYGSYAW